VTVPLQAATERGAALRGVAPYLLEADERGWHEIRRSDGSLVFRLQPHETRLANGILRRLLTPEPLEP
jgi:hypothetical protein